MGSAWLLMAAQQQCRHYEYACSTQGTSTSGSIIKRESGEVLNKLCLGRPLDSHSAVKIVSQGCTPSCRRAPPLKTGSTQANAMLRITN